MSGAGLPRSVRCGPLAAAALLVPLAACAPDETLTGYGAADRTWRLTEIGGQRFAAEATIAFPEQGRIAGTAPCNAFSGEQSAPYPWFRAEALAVTEAACPDLQDEARFFAALAAMRQAEIGGDTLILTGENGLEMVFTASPL